MPAPAREAMATLAAPIDATWYETRALDVPPKVLGEARPAYPEAARRAGLEGEVLLGLRIDETGAVREARVLSAAPPGVFEAAALAAYGAARFMPARIQGRPVRAEVRLRAVFRLDDE
jgi:protein TonB